MSIIKKDDSQSLTKIIGDTINQLQQGEGCRIKIKHTVTETLTLEVGGLKDNPIIKDYERTEENFTVNSDPLPIGENSKLESNDVKVNQGVENFSQEVKKEVEIPVNLENQSNSNSNGNASSG